MAGLDKPNTLTGRESGSSHSSTATTSGPAIDTSDAELAKTFSAIRGMIREEVVKMVNAVYIFDLKGCTCSCHRFVFQ